MLDARGPRVRGGRHDAEHLSRARRAASLHRERGLWQVLDGLTGEAGVTGRTWATNTPVEIDSVTRSPEYLEAIPGVVAEICVPIVVAGRSVGALNVESLSPLPTDTLARMRTYAQLLARRLAVIGFQSEVSSWQRSARASARIADLVFNRHNPGDTLRVICDAALHDSACLIRDAARDFAVGEAFGPLADAFLGLASRASLARGCCRQSLVLLQRGRSDGTQLRWYGVSQSRRRSLSDRGSLAREQSPDRHNRSGQHPSPPHHPQRRRTPRAPRRTTRRDAPEPDRAHLIAVGGGSVLGGGGLGVADRARPA